MPALQNSLLPSRRAGGREAVAGGIAHDFNNILSSIIGFTELALEDAQVGSLLEDNRQEVFAASKRAKQLVRQILAFARQSEEERKPIQLDRMIAAGFKFIRSTIPSTINTRSDIESNALIMGIKTLAYKPIVKAGLAIIVREVLDAG